MLKSLVKNQNILDRSNRKSSRSRKVLKSFFYKALVFTTAVALTMPSSAAGESSSGAKILKESSHTSRNGQTDVVTSNKVIGIQENYL